VVVESFGPIRAVTRAGVYGYALVLCAMITFNLDIALLWRTVGVLSAIALFGTAAMPVLICLSADDARR
jgi:hypothetical protein